MLTKEEMIEKIQSATECTADEKAAWCQGVERLDELGWPPELVTPAMAQRGLSGLIPKYEGMQSFWAYRAQWASIDGPDDLARKLHNENVRKANV